MTDVDSAALPSDQTVVMPADLRRLAHEARGFMPVEEGDLLYAEALAAAGSGPLLEVGTWCGKSAVYLGAAVRRARELGAPDAVAFTVDHHRGSEENQPGWEYHDPSLVDAHSGRIDTLPFFRRTMVDVGLEDEVVAVVGRAPLLARHWGTPLALLFIDGGHTDEHVTNDYLGFGRWVAAGGTLVFHDVFEHPEDGGQAPWRCYRRAVESGHWEETRHLGSMRVLRRVVGGAGDRLDTPD